MRMKIETGGYKPEASTPEEQKRSGKLIKDFYLALEQDEIERRQRGSGLPNNWRDRFLRN